jgi:hypothetical protein
MDLQYTTIHVVPRLATLYFRPWISSFPLMDWDEVSTTSPCPLTESISG